MELSIEQLTSKVDVEFNIVGSSICIDHAHHLFGAISEALNVDLHNAKWLGIHPIRGNYDYNDRIYLNKYSKLQLRVDFDKVNIVLGLVNRKITIGNDTVIITMANIKPLRPTKHLHSRIVVIKPHLKIEKFATGIFKQLQELNVGFDFEQSDIIINEKPKIVRVHDKKIIGYGVTLTNLTQEQSVAVQIAGLGGKRRMGCGLFVPTKLYV